MYENKKQMIEKLRKQAECRHFYGSVEHGHFLDDNMRIIDTLIKVCKICELTIYKTETDEDEFNRL